MDITKNSVILGLLSAMPHLQCGIIFHKVLSWI